MNNNKNNLQRMIVISPEIFDKWKKIITEDQILSELDKSMRNILFNNKLDDIKKWHHYHENLLKYSFAKKGKNNHQSKHSKFMKSDHETQTHLIPKFNKFTQTLATDENFEIDKSKKNIKNNNNEVLIQSHHSESEDNDIVYDNDEDEDNIEEDDMEIDMDDEYRAQALEGTNKDVRIVRERKSTDPLHYKSFELSDGQVVSVPTQMTTRSMKRKFNTSNTDYENNKKLKQSNLSFNKKIKKIPSISKQSSDEQKSTPSKKTGFLKWNQYPY